MKLIFTKAIFFLKPFKCVHTKLIYKPKLFFLYFVRFEKLLSFPINLKFNVCRHTFECIKNKHTYYKKLYGVDGKLSALHRRGLVFDPSHGGVVT